MSAPRSPSLGPASDGGPNNRALMGFAVIAEQDACASLLRGGVRLLREQRFASTDLEAVLALLAPGLERLSKLALGTVLYETTGHWPTERGWKAGWGDQARRGHEVEALVRKVRETIEGRQELARRHRLARSRRCRFQPPVAPLLTIERGSAAKRLLQLALVRSR